MRFEYRIEKVDTGSGQYLIEAEYVTGEGAVVKWGTLNDLGADRWEAVGALGTADDNELVPVLFKRPKEPTDD